MVAIPVFCCQPCSEKQRDTQAVAKCKVLILSENLLFPTASLHRYRKKWHILYKRFFLLYDWVGNDVVIGTAVTHPD